MYNYNKLCNDFLQYKKSLGYKYNTDTVVINSIKKYLIDNNVEIITKETIEKYVKLNNNLDTNTIARNMNVFKELCKYLELQRISCYQIPNKIYTRKKNKFIPYIFSHDEIKLIYSNLNIINTDYHYSYYQKIIYPIIIKILYQTGMRIGEILNLKIQDYSYEKQLFHLKNTKNNQERLIILPEKLNQEIKVYYRKFLLDKTDDHLLFLTSHTSIEKYFYKILKTSNIKRYENKPRLHDLRHTFVVHNFEKIMKTKNDINIFLPVLQKYLGHQSLNSLSYYFSLTRNILNDVNNVSEINLGYLIPKIGDEYEE